MSPGWRETLQELLPTGRRPDPRAPGGVAVGPPAWVGFRALEMSEVVEESATVASCYSTTSAGELLPRALPGHTCVTAVLAGQTAYSTPPLEPPGPDEVLNCSARPVGDLVLDL